MNGAGSVHALRRGRIHPQRTGGQHHTLKVISKLLTSSEGQALACRRWAEARPSEKRLRLNDHKGVASITSVPQPCLPAGRLRAGVLFATDLEELTRRNERQRKGASRCPTSP